MLGNKGHYEGPRPVRLDIVAPPSDLKITIPIIRVHFEDGDVADYPDVTSTELWAAYNFIQPSKRFDLPPRAAGLVGAINREGGTDFAIHPAIIRTYLSREAMRLDLTIRAAGKSGVSVPSALKNEAWSSFDGYGYQWFDEEARIRVQDGRIRIEPETEPTDCFLRFRVAPPAPNLRLDSFLKAICRSEGSYRSVERFAKVVAVLNWYAEATGRRLPDLPSFVKPVIDDIPAQSSLPYNAVFAKLPNDEVASAETAAQPPSEREAKPEETTPTVVTPDPDQRNWKAFFLMLGFVAFIFWRWTRN